MPSLQHQNCFLTPLLQTVCCSTTSHIRNIVFLNCFHRTALELRPSFPHSVLFQHKQNLFHSSYPFLRLLQAPPRQTVHIPIFVVSVYAGFYWLHTLSPFFTSSLAPFIYTSRMVLFTVALCFNSAASYLALWPFAKFYNSPSSLTRWLDLTAANHYKR